MLKSVSPGTGGGGGGGGGGSYLGAGSITAVTTEIDPVNGGFRPVTFTQSGVEWTVSYNLDGSRAYLSAFAGELIVTYAYTPDGDFAYVSGNYIDVEGRIRMDWATAANLGDDIVAGMWVVGTDLDNGLQIFVTDIVGGVTLEWSDLIDWWRGPNGAPITLAVFGNTSYYTGSTSESPAQITATIPGKLVAANGGQVCAWANCEANVSATPANATTGTLNPRWKLGSDTISSSTSGTGVRKMNAGMVVTNDGARNMQSANLGGTPYSSATSSSAGNLTNDTALDQNITLTFQLSAGTDQIRVRQAKVWVVN